MVALRVQIIRLTDHSFPGWAEANFRDAEGLEKAFVDKVPIFTGVHLTESSDYPQPGFVACEILRNWVDELGRRRFLISTERPWAIETKAAETLFEVFEEQLQFDQA